MLKFDNKVVVITGSAQGIGFEYAKFFASRGAKLVLNDFGKRNGEYLADIACREIKNKFGVQAVPNYDSVEFGEKVIETAVQAFGRVDVLINNAGILRDKSFSKMTVRDYEMVMKVHVDGSFRCSLAAWKIFKKQKYGRIINTSSGSGINGNFG